MSKKSPRFFCDNCGSEVPLAVKNCPGCGRYFASVRCPACGFSAEEASFKNGCPACGYSAPPGSESRPVPQNFTKNKKPEPVPYWIYILAVAAFAAIFAALVFKMS